MGVIRLMIVEDNAEQRMLNARFFSSRSEFSVSGVFDNGLTALENVGKLMPDAVLLDMTLPYMDGLSYLENVSRLGLHKHIAHIVLSASDSYVSEAMKYADAYYIKPFSYGILANKIISLCRNETCYPAESGGVTIKAFTPEQRSTYGLFTQSETRSDVQAAPPGEPVLTADNSRQKLDRDIMRILLKAGIPPHVRGFTYLHACIKACVLDVSKLEYVSKNLYPAVAKTFNTTGQSVERAIRHAIDAAWYGDTFTEDGYLYKFLGIYFSRKPANRQFLASLVNVILLGDISV